MIRHSTKVTFVAPMAAWRQASPFWRREDAAAVRAAAELFAPSTPGHQNFRDINADGVLGISDREATPNRSQRLT
jgi:hypothetical protein